MNDSERAKVADVIEAELDSYCPSPFNGAFAVSLMQIIERLLTTRPEPAALCRCGHPESDHYKYILNGAETWSCKSCDPTSGLAGDQELSGDAWEQRMAADHPYEPTRPEPAADAVEAAAEAMFTLEKNASGALVQWDDLLDNYGRNGVAGKAVYRDLARAALQAAAVEPEPGLDELLDSVNPEAIISFVFQHDSEPWIAGIRWPYTDELSIDSQTFARAEGTGPTRMAAIASAVRQAKENGDG